MDADAPSPHGQNAAGRPGPHRSGTQSSVKARLDGHLSLLFLLPFLDSPAKVKPCTLNEINLGLASNSQENYFATIRTAGNSNKNYAASLTGTLTARACHKRHSAPPLHCWQPLLELLSFVYCGLYQAQSSWNSMASHGLNIPLPHGFIA